MSLHWSEVPFRLISSTGGKDRQDIPSDHYCRKNAWIMAQTHNTIFRSLNSVYSQAPHVVPGTKDATDLLFYCSVVYDFIHTHHLLEEEIYFPGIEEMTGIPGLMEENIEQHECLKIGLEKLRKYASESSSEKYSAETLRSIIEDLSGPLGDHLHDEIPSIMDLHDKIDSQALKKIYEKMHHEAERRSDNFIAGPFVLGCQDRNFLVDGEEASFPEVPAIVLYIVDLFVAPRYAGAWRFNPSDMFGQPRHAGFRNANTNTSRRSYFISSILVLLLLAIGYFAIFKFDIFATSLGASDDSGSERDSPIWTGFRQLSGVELSFINLCLVFVCAFLLFLRVVLIALKRFFTVQVIVL